MKPALRPMETRWRACDRLPSKQAVAGSHPNDWLLDSPLEGEAGQECLVCPPICIKLRTAELWIAQLLEGTRGVLPPVGPAIGSHRGTRPSQHHLPGDLASYRQNQPGHRPLDDLPRFDQAATRISPTAFQSHPMLKQQAQELGVQLGQDALGLAASPRVYFAFLRATSFHNSSIGPRKRMSATTCSAESTWLSTLVNTSSHSNWRCLLALTLWRGPSSLARMVACSSLGPSSTSLDSKARGDGVPPRAWLVARQSRMASSGKRRAIKRTGTRLPLACSHPHLDHLLTLRQTAQPLRQVPQPSLLLAEEHVRFDPGDPEAS